MRDDRRSCCRDAADRVGHDAGRVELGRDPAGQVTMFTLNVTPDRVVAREGARAVGAWDADTLVTLPDVGPQVCFVAVGSFAEGTS